MKTDVENVIRQLNESIRYSEKMRDYYFDLYNTRAKMVALTKQRLDTFLERPITADIGSVEYTNEGNIRTVLLKEYSKEAKQMAEAYESAIRYADHVGFVKEKIEQAQAMVTKPKSNMLLDNTNYLDSFLPKKKTGSGSGSDDGFN